MAKIRKDKPMLRLYAPSSTKIYQNQEKKLKIDRVRSFAGLKNRHRAFKLKINPRIRKIAKILDKEIWLIDGVKIRGNEKYPSVDVDFTSGGHGCRYIYSPLNEIWIDKAIDKDDIWPTIWHEYTERHLMERGLGYNEAHDYAARIEIGIRHGTEFVLPVANFKQRTNYSCGAASMLMVLEYFGRKFTEKQMIRMARATPEKGTDMKDMVAVAKSLGFKTRWKQNWTLQEVKKELNIGLPVIVNFQHSPKFGEGHYAVIVGYTDDEFIISDPSNDESAYRREKIEHFMKRWYELEDKTVREGIVIYK